MTTPTPKIRLLIADDQELIRDGLALMLAKQPDIEVVGVAEDGEEAIRLALLHTPDVVLLDIQMPRKTGIEATRHIHQALPTTRIIILTTYDADNLVFDAIRAGAHGYLLKGVKSAVLAEAIRSVKRGESQLDPLVAGKVMDEFRRAVNLTVNDQGHLAATQPIAAGRSPLIETLTEREHDILSLVAQGLSNKEIGDKLFLTEGTVKNYLGNILGKLHANDRTQALITAVRHGLVTIS